MPADLPLPDLGLAVLFTIDTECGVHRMRDPDPDRAVDELIFGDFGGGERLGIDLHMDLLEEHGHKGCFFLDILMEHQFGQAALERVIAAILERGHEIELHVHSHHLAFASDPQLQALARGVEDFDPVAFRAVLNLATELFERRLGRPPVAHRCGGYHLSDEYLAVIEDLCIGIDASLMPYLHNRTSDAMGSRTQPFAVGDVLEVPTTWFLREDGEDAPSTRHYAPNATAGDPWTGVVVPTADRPLVATFVSHSFELTATESHPETFNDEWMARLRDHVGGDREALWMPKPGYRFRTHAPAIDTGKLAHVNELLRRVAERRDARCVTYAEIESHRDMFLKPSSSPVDPLLALDRRTGTVAIRSTRARPRGVRAPGTVVGAPLPDAVHWRGADIAIVGAGATVEQVTTELESARAFAVCAAPDARDLSPAGTHDVVVWITAGVADSEMRVSINAIASAVRRGGAVVIRHVPFGDDEAPSALDVPTITSMLTEAGLAVDEVRRDRQESPAVVLPGIDPAELTTSSAMLIAKRPFNARRHKGRATSWQAPSVDALRDAFPAVRRLPLSADAMPVSDDCIVVEPSAFDPDLPDTYIDVAAALHARARPGCAVLTTLAVGGAVASPSTGTAAMLHAGLEIVAMREQDDALLVHAVRPLEISEIREIGR